VTLLVTNDAPVAICQDITHPVEAGRAWTPSPEGVNDESAYDPDGGGVTFSTTLEGALERAGPHQVTLTVFDEFGASATCDAIVTLTSSPPIALCKGATKVVTNNCEWTPTDEDVVSFHNGSYDEEVGIKLTLSPMNPLGLGEHTIKLEVEDECGGTATFETIVTVIDDEQLQGVKLDCSGPGVSAPCDVPVEYDAAYLATKANGCEVTMNVLDNYACEFCNGAGKTVDKLAGGSCQVRASNSIFTVYDSGGVGDHISFTVKAQDSVHVVEAECTVCVTKPENRQRGPFGCPPAGTCSRALTSVMTRSKGRRSALVGPLTKP